MDAKKSGLLSRFTLQIATAFFLFISVLLLTASFQGRVIFQGFNHVGVVNSSASIVSSWPFTFPAKPNSSANAFGVALGKVNSDRNGSLGSVRQNAPEGGRESNGSLPVAGIADAGEQNTTTSKEADRSNNGYVKQSIEDSYQNCDIFDGRWERDESKPYYPAGSCPHIDRDFDCHANGRPDSGFVKWRWQPNRCDVPRLNATDFLERLRGKKLVFVGDSLNRNMWESLVCILRHSISNKKKVHEISGKTEFKKCLQDYNCTVDFVGSPFLVRESLFSSANGTVDTLRLDLMDKTTSMYHDADIIVFNTGHWWTHEKTSKGENYYQEGDYVHKRLKVLEAYKRALKTWGRWVDRSIDTNRTHVFFRGGGQWNSGGKCHKETEPIFNTTHLAKYPSKMKVLENVLHEMKTPVAYLNISRLTDHRKDGHPSIYRKKYDTPEELLAAERSQDCSHWCLPGVPDTWNELLYASMLKAGIGS
ncbi:Protein trichome birefringence-like 2 [Linum perenne]